MRPSSRETRVDASDSVAYMPPYAQGRSSALLRTTDFVARSAAVDSTVTVFRNGHVFDGRRHRPDTGVVVGGGRVVAVLPEQELEGYVDRAAVRDLGGGLLLPGFQDAHVHAVQGGLERLSCDLSDLGRPEQYLAAVGRHAAQHPQAQWLTGGGWSISAFGHDGPTAAELDRVVPDRPVFLVNRDHHGAWVNTAALERAGVHRGSADPADGRIERDQDGRPTGLLHEGAMGLVGRLLPEAGEEEKLRAFLEAQRYLHSLGITAWQDAILGDYAGMRDPSDTYLRAATAGLLTARVRGALWWDRERGAEQVPELVDRRARYTQGRLVAGAVKIMQDGIAENFTAAMTSSYLDGCGRRTGNHGLSFVDPAALRDHVTRLDAEDFQVHVHAIGDRAVREALDAFEAARGAHGPRGNRHHVAHIQVVAPADRPRFAALDVTANMQPLWAHLDDQMVDFTLPFLDQEAAGWQYPFGDLARAGARLAIGSDWPVSTPDPLQGIHVAVNRTAHGEAGRAGSEQLLPDQALSLEQAFAAYTSGSAFVNHLDDTGSLAPGSRADLALLDRDPFTADPGEIGAARVVATYVDGAAVFEG
jgi:predicted amidohydrolase YtcJ